MVELIIGPLFAVPQADSIDDIGSCLGILRVNDDLGVTSDYFRVSTESQSFGS